MHTVASRLPAWIEPAVLTLLRIATSVLFMQHGVQKLFGWLLSPERQFAGAPPAFSQFWIAGVLEVFGGLLIALGLFTRPVAFVLAGEMAVAYWLAHFGKSFWPILNGGEATLLYSAIFLCIAVFGAGPFSLDALLRRRQPGAAM